MIFVEISLKSRFWSKFSKNLDFDRNFQNISILVEFFLNISILVEIFEECRFWWHFSKYHDFGRNFRKISILVEIFDKSPFWSRIKKKS